jgi:curved DNA-binding protein CbpA
MRTAPSNPYVVLGVPADASAAEISHAYRTLLRRHHPDTRASDSGQHSAAADLVLQEVLDAYAVLGDPHRRAGYDTHAGIRKPPAPSPDRVPIRIGRTTRTFLRAGPVHWQPTDYRREQEPATSPVTALLRRSWLGSQAI